RLPAPGGDRRPLRPALGPRPEPARLLRRLRVLEAGLHPRGRVRPLRGRDHGPRGPRLRGLRRPRRAVGRDRSQGGGELMADLYEMHDRPEVHEPVMVMTLEGWIDAGLGAAAAVAALLG